MSFRALRWAFRQQLAPTAKFVLVALADHADDAGACWPSVAALSRHTCLSERTVQAGLRAIEAGGFMAAERSAGHRSSRYVLDLRQGQEKQLTVPPNPAAAAGSTPQDVQGIPRSSCTVEPDETPQEVHPDPAGAAPIPRSSCTDTPQELHPNHHRTTTEPSVTRDAPAAPTPRDARDELWADGLPILRTLTGKPDAGCRKLLGLLLREACDDAAVVLIVLREAEELRPADPAAWLMAAAYRQAHHHRRRANDEAAGRTGSKPSAAAPKLAGPVPTLNDPPEAWRVYGGTWEADEHGVFRVVIDGNYLDLVAELVCQAAGMDGHAGGIDWRPLVRWIEERFDPAKRILPAIKRVASRPGYQPPRTLGYFDAAVRESVETSAW